MSEWIQITDCANIPAREGRTTIVGDREIAIFNLGDRFLAIDNRCPHRGGPLGDGIIAGESVVCPLHAWKICLETGTVQRPATAAACVQTYETRVVDGVILLLLPPKTAEATDEEGQAA